MEHNQRKRAGEHKRADGATLWRVLARAVDANDAARVQCLLEARADVNRSRDDALLVRAVVSANDVAGEADTRVLELLLRAGADVHASCSEDRPALFYAVTEPDHAGDYHASRFACASLLLAAGADVHTWGDIVMCVAVRCCVTRLAALAIAHGASIVDTFERHVDTWVSEDFELRGHRVVAWRADSDAGGSRAARREFLSWLLQHDPSQRE